MKKFISIFLVISLFFIGFQIFLVVGESEEEIEMSKEIRGGQRGSILYVGPGQTYTKIQDAIIASNTGDTIRVYTGKYNENVTIDKSINLIGNGTSKTTIDGKGFGDVVKITVDWVNITGFTIINGGNGFGDSGIELKGVKNCKVSYNEVRSNDRNGILLSSSSSMNQILSNNVSLNGEYGIWVWSSSNNRIINNNVSSNNRSGIGFFRSFSNTAATNTITHNGITIAGDSKEHFNSHNITLDNSANGKPIYYINNKTNMNLNGIPAGQVIISNSTNIKLNNLHINYTDIGVIIGYSSQIKLTNCNISNNLWSLFSDHSSFLTISDNILINNEIRGGYGSCGFWIYYSNSSTISFNNFSEIQGDGIRLIKSSNNNITNNHMVGERPIFDIAISINYDSNNKIINNNILKWFFGIGIDSSSNNHIMKNNVSYNNYSIGIGSSSNNLVVNNFVLNNNNGISLGTSANNNWVYHNNIINNTNQAFDDASNKGNQWDNGYPSGGNYWSDYMGKDDGSGTGNHSISGDGIGDTEVPHLGLDNYPFIKPIIITNLKPIANAGPDQQVFANQTVSFYGNGSYDPDFDALTYNWDFGDGTSTGWQSTSNTSHSYNKIGNYSVTLKVSDGSLWDIDTCTIIVLKGPPLASSPWPKFRANLKNTGLSKYDTSKNSGKLKWQFIAGAMIQSSPSIGSDGTIYFGSYDNYLYAINTNGTKLWSFKTDGSIEQSSSAIASDGTIYIGCRSFDYTLYAINSDGTEKWKVYTGGFISSSPAIAPDGTIYVGSDSLALFAFNPNGTVKWKFMFDNPVVMSSPAIDNDGIVYIGVSGKVFAIYPNGTLKWSCDIGGSIKSSPAIGSDGTVYIGHGNYNLNAIYPNGTKKWAYTTGTGIESSPAIASDGTIYIGSGDEKLHAVNPDGTKKWTFKTENAIESSPAIGADGTIYVGSFDNKLYAIYPNGTEKWSLKEFGQIRTSPAIGSDGTIYVSCNEGKLSAIGNLTDAKPPKNNPPIANAGPDQNVTVNQTVYFDGSGSYDPDGESLTYKWDFGDGATTGWQNSCNTSHSYNKIGIYTVTLTVRDITPPLLLTDIDNCIVNVLKFGNYTPIIKLSFLSLIELDEDFGKFSQKLTDYESHWDSEITGDNLKWYVTGNTNTVFYMTGDNSTGENADTIIFNSIINQHGTEVITYHLHDPFGFEAVINQTVIVHPVNDPPIANGGLNQNITVGQSITFDGSTSYDPDGDIITYEWTSSIDGKLGINPIIKNIKLSAGIHTITLKVSDSEFTVTDICIVRVFTISGNLPPRAKISPIKVAVEGEKVYLSAADSFDEDGHIMQYIWDFGDNSEELYTNKTDIEHIWKSAGNYTITLTVIDNQSAKDSDSLEIIVTQSETIDSDGDGRTSQDNTFAIILVVIAIIILLLIVTSKLFFSRSKRKREKRPYSEDEMLDKVKDKFLSGESLKELEYSRNEIDDMLERTFKAGQISEITYNLIRSEILYLDEAEFAQPNNSIPNGKE